MITIHGGKFRLNALSRFAAKFLLLPAVSLLSTGVVAQSTDELFRGTWQVQTPEKGALVIILKNQGIASYFWGDNTDRNVYQGSWSADETSANIAWNGGSSHTITRTDSGFTATYKSAAGSNLYNAPAMQLPQEVLGQWAKPPTREDEMRSARDEAKGYFGIWKFADSEDFLFVEADRSAASNIGGDRGQRGEWAKQGSELHIIWDSGHYGILRESERGFNYKQVEPGKVIEDDETEAVSVARTIESSVPASWYADYTAEREADTGGIAFSSRKLARAFYRGDWLVRRNGDRYERLELARFGGLKTSVDRSLDGQWTLSGQDVFMRWDDGMRKVLSPVGRSFVLYEYRPGRPLDGVPTRILPAAPADAGKLAEHLEGRKDVAEQMRQMAEAAGIDPQTRDDAGWGRNFARWAWPFGDDESMSTEAMLAEEFEEEDESDPWWWPFWSENPAATSDEETRDEEPVPAEQVEDASPAESPAPEVNEAAPVPVEMREVTSKEENAQPSEAEQAPTPPATNKKRSTKDWVWPF